MLCGAVRDIIARMKEVVKTHLKQVSCTGVAGNVAAQFAIGFVGFGHHGQRVPAHQRA